ncbi:Cytochrome c553 [Tistlia consotensis]|uniref:Cytochrome c553 n=1 Tax=Tistlia consotensis USBA 355 TaxID=560819 RepID=A0A1Y6CGE0_9PROT|nr:hypothetical protein [Tistlia consotensis]SMF54229.1 Cytochrome c553 [Tistlia consotensis USBA 355]SNR86702.1 Cytochrome c553 [Tistlia consotensis]
MRPAFRLFGCLCLCLAVLSGPPAAAQEAPAKAAVCAGCHGENGVPTGPLVPVIWGQEFYYLYVQLRDFAAGRRKSEVMTPIAEELSKDDMKALAGWFSKQTWPTIRHEVPSDAQTAEALKFDTAGQCSACHLGGFNGNSRVPRLAGQTASYLLQTMTAFRDKTRLNAPDMNNIMAGSSDETLAATAAYISAR